jgi:hypothetical protein
MMLKREVILQTGMFDESFFIYCEEIDWARRIRKAGWQVFNVPAAHVIHLAGQSTAQARPRSVIDLWTSRLLLFRKHYPRWKLFLARWMIDAGMRRKTRLARNDPSLEQRDEIIGAYERVRKMAWSNE